MSDVKSNDVVLRMPGEPMLPRPAGQVTGTPMPAVVAEIEATVKTIRDMGVVIEALAYVGTQLDQALTPTADQGMRAGAIDPQLVELSIVNRYMANYVRQLQGNREKVIARLRSMTSPLEAAGCALVDVKR